MTDERSAETAAELDEIGAKLSAARYVLRDLHVQHNNCGYGKMAKAVELTADTIDALRKQLDEARMQASGDRIILARALEQAGADAEHDEKVIEALRAANAQMAAALRGLLEQAEACWRHHYGHMSEDEMATVPQHIADGRAALPQEPPASHAPVLTEDQIMNAVLAAGKEAAKRGAAGREPASPSPVLRDRFENFQADGRLRDAVIEECALAYRNGSGPFTYDYFDEAEATIRALATTGDRT